MSNPFYGVQHVKDILFIETSPDPLKFESKPVVVEEMPFIKERVVISRPGSSSVGIDVFRCAKDLNGLFQLLQSMRSKGDTLLVDVDGKKAPLSLDKPTIAAVARNLQNQERERQAGSSSLGSASIGSSSSSSFGGYDQEDRVRIVIERLADPPALTPLLQVWFGDGEYCVMETVQATDDQLEQLKEYFSDYPLQYETVQQVRAALFPKRTKPAESGKYAAHHVAIRPLGDDPSDVFLLAVDSAGMKAAWFDRPFLDRKEWVWNVLPKYQDQFVEKQKNLSKVLKDLYAQGAAFRYAQLQ